jgi:hypothetical protein
MNFVTMTLLIQHLKTTTLSKALLSAGLLGGVALSALGAGSAQAAWGPHAPNGYGCVVGGPSACDFTGNEPTPTTVPIPTPGTVTTYPYDKILTLLGQTGLSSGDAITFVKQPSAWVVALDFVTDRTAGTSGNLNYKIEITDPDFSFRTAQLTANIGTAGAYDLTKKFYTDATYTTEITSWGLSNPTNTLGEIGGQTIFVKDTWSVPGGSLASINNIGNNYTQSVPGPLSFLGLGAVLGYSRKLRKRFQTKAAFPGLV